MSTQTLTQTASVESGVSDGRSAHVPLACFGNGRNRFPPRNSKATRPADLFVPSQTLEQFMKTKPEIVQARWGPALLQLGGATLLLAFSAVLLAVSPWFFLPVAWMLSGVALSLLFIIGHDCAHGNWAPSPLVNALVGELAFLLLLQPFESFKLLHQCDATEAEVAKVAKVAPVGVPAEGSKKSRKSSKPAPPTNAAGQSVTIENASSTNTEPLPWWLQALGEHLSANFAPQEVPEGRALRVWASIGLASVVSVVLALYLTFLPGYLGPLAVARFWALPLLAYCSVYSGVCRLWTLNVRAFLPRDSPHSFSIASYNYALLTRMLATSAEFGASVRNSSLVSLVRGWWPRIHWINTAIIVFVPIISMIGLFTTPLQRPTAIWAMLYYFITGLGITAGYHRLFAHRAYEANWITRVAMLFAGSGALEGSVKWWCGGHRVHHRYTDTPKDPYNAQGGFWYAHIGWMLLKPDPANYAKADIKDLAADPLIRFQHKYYLFVGPFCAIVFPTLVGGLLWGDWAGSFFYAGYMRLFFVHHSTFCVNSVAHYFGEHSFDDERSPRDHILTALVTFGEGYHNFHHEFPNDYRNGIQWYHYDPTKWLIAGLSKIGATFNLKVFPKNEIKRGVLYMREKKLAALRAETVAPVCKDKLPQWTWEQLAAKVAGTPEPQVAGAEKADSKKPAAAAPLLIVVQGFVHDVSSFAPTHPGGLAFLKAYSGKDATEVFLGRTNPVVYKHSHAAENLLSNMRVATIIEPKQSQEQSTQQQDAKKEQ